MQRRGGSGKPVKRHRRSANRANARKAPANPSVVDLQEQLDQRTRERDEALEQQAATADVLQIISSSPGELGPVFNALIENATRLCGAEVGTLALYDGSGFGGAAVYGHSKRYADVVSRFHRAPPRTGLARMKETRQTVQVTDVSTDVAYESTRQMNPDFERIRTALYVPIAKGRDLIGAFMIYRHEVRPFTSRQIDLVKNFAAQAAIAIENTRLLNELRQRTEDLSESLEQQTATSEVLQVISSSRGELEPVFQAMLDQATRVCNAKFGIVFRYEGDLFHPAAWLNAPPAFVDFIHKQGAFAPQPGQLFGRLCQSKTVISFVDRASDENSSPVVRYGGARSSIAVPMLKDNDLVGAFFIYRTEVHPFTEKQIELVKNFATQAVIAIENTRLLNELRESLQQQTATADVLKVISSSPGDLQPVFDALLTNAIDVCEARFGFMYRGSDTEMKIVAHKCDIPAYLEIVKNTRFTPQTIVVRVAETKQVVQVPDITATQRYADREPLAVAAAEIGRVRTILGVPLLKENQVTGAIFLYRQEVRPFTEKQIDLVKNFAAQAVIAIENARLLNELRESLQQQTATADVLKVISGSPGTLDPVFSTMLAKATELCEASYGTLWLHEGNGYRAVAMHGDLPPVWIEQWRSGAIYRPGPDRPMARAAEGRQPIQIADMRTDPSYLQGDPLPVAGVEIAGIRTLLLVPMFKESEHVGLIAIYRTEVLPFTEKQIDLVKNFAAQAVIAIENTRLLNELRESLQQQTGTANVLKVISSSPGQLEPVFNAMLENAVRICGAKFGNLFLREGAALRAVAFYGTPQAYIEERQRHPMVHPGPRTGLGRLMATKQPVQIPDIQNYEPDSSDAAPGTTGVSLVRLAGARTVLAVPMVKESVLIGAIVIYRQEILQFTDKQIELVQNFAAQAVIAIENTRLLSELRESLQQQTATADVLKIISRSTFDLQTVLQTLVESAARLCDADNGTITRERDGAFYRAEAYGLSKEFMDYVQDIPIKPEKGSASGRALLEGRLVHIADVKADPEYTWSEAQRLGDFRTILAVPMLREGVSIGVLTLSRTDVRPFTDKQLELVTTFADQAAIAIENVRLFDSVDARTRELAKSLEELRATQDRLVQTQKLASLGQLTAGIAHEIKNPLNFVNNFSGVSAELIDELQDTLKGIPFDDKARSELNELTDTLRGNLDKVVQHGKRADAIVKNMLLHSHQGSGEHRPVAINALLEESLKLAYHGARAEKNNFNVMVEQSFDPDAGAADIFPQEVTRVLLNLISNAVYATGKKAPRDGETYKPTLVASTKDLGDRVEIRIRDNGTGIQPDVKEKMFNPFFTTKPAGEGTGLGLSISHDIIVKQHGGSIEVDTQPGKFTEIRIVLPRTAASVSK
jgi:two-component system, NtrC family, sensor kinase